MEKTAVLQIVQTFVEERVLQNAPIIAVVVAVETALEAVLDLAAVTVAEAVETLVRLQ